MDKKIVTLTQVGYDNLVAERDRMINEDRPRIVQAIAEARAQGDLSENADYSAAREEQAALEARIEQYTYMIEHAEIIQGGNADRVSAGVTVTYVDLTDDTIDTVTIVGSFETDPKHGKISNDCPLAQALADHAEGDRIMVNVEEPYEIMITKIEIRDPEPLKLN